MRIIGLGIDKERYMSIGLVFKADEKLYLTKYLGNGEFSDGFLITNNEPYENLGMD